MSWSRPTKGRDARLMRYGDSRPAESAPVSVILAGGGLSQLRHGLPEKLKLLLDPTAALAKRQVHAKRQPFTHAELPVKPFGAESACLFARKH